MSEYANNDILKDISDDEIDFQAITNKIKKSKCNAEKSKNSSRRYLTKFFSNQLSDTNADLLSSCIILFIICFVILAVFDKYIFIKSLYYNIASKACAITLTYILINYNIKN